MGDRAAKAPCFDGFGRQRANLMLNGCKTQHSAQHFPTKEFCQTLTSLMGRSTVCKEALPINLNEVMGGASGFWNSSFFGPYDKNVDPHVFSGICHLPSNSSLSLL